MEPFCDSRVRRSGRTRQSRPGSRCSQRTGGRRGGLGRSQRGAGTGQLSCGAYRDPAAAGKSLEAPPRACGAGERGAPDRILPSGAGNVARADRDACRSRGADRARAGHPGCDGACGECAPARGGACGGGGRLSVERRGAARSGCRRHPGAEQTGRAAVASTAAARTPEERAGVTPPCGRTEKSRASSTPFARVRETLRRGGRSERQQRRR